MMLHHISFMDSFSVEPVFDYHFNRSRTRRHRHLAERLERQLNHGNTFQPSHRRLFQKDGIGLSQTGRSTQLVIMSHGGWKELSHPQTPFTRQKGDGWTVVPKNLRLDFYTKDNDFTKGLSVLSEVNKRHTEAQKGLTPSLNTSKDDLRVLARARNIPQSKLEEEMMSQAIYRKEYATSNEKIKNYALYYHDQAKNIIQKHQDGSGYQNIDIAFITDKNHKKHLSDIFKAINYSGVKYDVIHFGACRINREEQ
ncbi:hypothetical protein C4A39_03573 [Escherichia coli]|nr:hypothetical protein C4A39_03573 [Escherichia coli]RDQ65327.1 hypothetical protein C4A28_03248 [Escherichia coli]